MKLKDLAKEARVSTRTARRRLRKLRIERPGTRWEFPRSQRRLVLRLIKDDRND